MIKIMTGVNDTSNKTGPRGMTRLAARNFNGKQTPYTTAAGRSQEKMGATEAQDLFITSHKAISENAEAMRHCAAFEIDFNAEEWTKDGLKMLKEFKQQAIRILYEIEYLSEYVDEMQFRNRQISEKVKANLAKRAGIKE